MFVNLFLILLLSSFGLNAQENTCSGGTGDFCAKPKHNILFVGKSGVGKSSLINMIYNYLRKISYDKPWEIVIPLMHGQTPYPVNVDAYKEYKVDLKPSGGSQTSEINRYTVETEHEVFILWDTPGFGDTSGFLKDKENADKIANAIEATNFAGVIITLAPADMDRTSEAFKSSISHIRGMLPKAFLKNLVGVYNRQRKPTKQYETDLINGFLERFDMRALSPTILWRFLHSALPPWNARPVWVCLQGWVGRREL
jgi:hypothetical protein